MTGPFLGENESVAKQEIIEAVLEEEPLDAAPTPNDQVAPNEPKPEESTQLERRRAILRAMYGDKFPLGNEGMEDDEDAWVNWGYDLWMSRSAAMRVPIWRARRNRLMRAGHQWIDSSGPGEGWVEPPRPRDALRLVYNMIDKALDQRLQIIADQQPGFTTTPATMDPDDKRVAQARQMACEFQFRQCDMRNKVREAEYWAQTDGVAFWQNYWDPSRGPWDDANPADRQKAGDMNCRTLRIEQVRVSPNATATEPPMWAVVRDVIPVSEAVARYGYTGVQAGESDDMNALANVDDDTAGMDSTILRYSNPGEGDRLRDTQSVTRITVYLAPSDALPNGLEVVIVGKQVARGPVDLLFGVIPIVRVTDGSTDPSYFCDPIMSQWIDSQVRMNVLLSKWGENIRVNSGGRMLARAGAISDETWFGGLTSLIEVRGVGAFDDIVRPIPGFSVGNDVKEAFVLEKTAFEDASGWNAWSRGQVSGDSGRAIIAAREQLERIFAPPVHALATALTDWCRVAVKVMQWGYVIPRAMGAVGRSRPDLARALSGENLDRDSAPDVFVEPATMMPMPLSFRLYMLDNWLTAGVIDMAEYRRRQKFAIVTDIDTPDEDQEARARRVVDALLNGDEPPEIRWQDNEAIHQDTLEREIILRDDLDPAVIVAAQQRWEMLGQQSQMKSMLLQPMAPGAGPAGPGAPGGASPGNPGAIGIEAGSPGSGDAPIGQAPGMTQMGASGTPDAGVAERAMSMSGGV